MMGVAIVTVVVVEVGGVCVGWAGSTCIARGGLHVVVIIVIISVIIVRIVVVVIVVASAVVVIIFIRIGRLACCFCCSLERPLYSDICLQSTPL